MKYFNLAVLVNLNERLPPSNPDSIEHFAQVAKKEGVDVHITSRIDDLSKFDGLFIRETVWTNKPVFKYICQAEHLGIPVIDNVYASLACENKIPMYGILQAEGISTPPTEVLDLTTDLNCIVNKFGLPLVFKIPNGMLGQGMVKVDKIDLQSLNAVRELLVDNSVILAQPFIETDFDWRIGILNNQPFYASHYSFVPGHWQIVRYDKENDRYLEGQDRSFLVKDVPIEILDLAMKASQPFGDGLFGIDIKETKDKLYVMEVNHNPAVRHGEEDRAMGPKVWQKLAHWFLDRRKET